MASHSLPEPYILDVSSGGSFKFRSFEEIKDWAEKELEAWLPLEDAEAHRKISGPFRSFPKQQTSHIRNLIASVQEAVSGTRDAPEAWEKVEGYLGGYARGLVEISRTAQGQLLIRTWHQDPDLASAMLGTLRGQVPNDKSLATAVRGSALIAAYQVAHGSKAEDEKLALNRLTADFSERFDTEYQRQREAAEQCDAVNRDLQTAYDERMAEFNDALKKHDAEMKRIETTFREQMRLRAPASFWRTKRNVHLGVAGVSLAVFASLIGVGLWIATTHGPTFWNAVFDKSAGFTLGPALLVSIPALAYFWLLKLIARIFATNLSSMASAGERATLISTFLALLLEEENAIKDDERVLVLQAIFRPGPGETGDEGPPANWLDFLIKRAK